MKLVKIVSRILFYLARVLSFLYFAAAAISVLAFTTKWGFEPREGGKYFTIYYPFTSKPFLNGDYTSTYIIFYFMLPLLFYGLFFLLLSNVFKVFFQPRLFTSYGVKQLRLFYLASFILPVIVLLILGLFAAVEAEVVALLLLHAVLGVFAYFLAAIFKQGVKLQNEQDLYI